MVIFIHYSVALIVKGLFFSAPEFQKMNTRGAIFVMIQSEYESRSIKYGLLSKLTGKRMILTMTFWKIDKPFDLCYDYFFDLRLSRIYSCLNRASQSVVFKSGREMVLRVFYFTRTKALTYYHINRSQRHLLTTSNWKALFCYIVKVLL